MKILLNKFLLFAIFFAFFNAAVFAPNPLNDHLANEANKFAEKLDKLMTRNFHVNRQEHWLKHNEFLSAHEAGIISMHWKIDEFLLELEKFIKGTENHRNMMQANEIELKKLIFAKEEVLQFHAKYAQKLQYENLIEKFQSKVGCTEIFEILNSLIFNDPENYDKTSSKIPVELLETLLKMRTKMNRFIVKFKLEILFGQASLDKAIEKSGLEFGKKSANKIVMEIHEGIKRVINQIKEEYLKAPFERAKAHREIPGNIPNGFQNEFAQFNSLEGFTLKSGEAVKNRAYTALGGNTIDGIGNNKINKENANTASTSNSQTQLETLFANFENKLQNQLQINASPKKLTFDQRHALLCLALFYETVDFEMDRIMGSISKHIEQKNADKLIAWQKYDTLSQISMELLKNLKKIIVKNSLNDSLENGQYTEDHVQAWTLFAALTHLLASIEENHHLGMTPSQSAFAHDIRDNAQAMVAAFERVNAFFGIFKEFNEKIGILRMQTVAEALGNSMIRNSGVLAELVYQEYLEKERGKTAVRG